MTRRQIREHVLRLIFNLSFRETEKDEQVQLYFEQPADEDIANPVLFATPEEKEYIGEKAKAAAEHFDEIDALLNETAKGWTTARMGKTDLAILRLAVYEMLYDDEIPVGVAINEAVELAKQYGEEESASFINGILAKLVSTVPPAKSAQINLDDAEEHAQAEADDAEKHAQTEADDAEKHTQTEPDGIEEDVAVESAGQEGM